MVNGHRSRNRCAVARRFNRCDCGAGGEVDRRWRMNFYCKKCGQSYDAWTIANCGCSRGEKNEIL